MGGREREWRESLVIKETEKGGGRERKKKKKAMPADKKKCVFCFVFFHFLSFREGCGVRGVSCNTETETKAIDEISLFLFFISAGFSKGE